MNLYTALLLFGALLLVQAIRRLGRAVDDAELRRENPVPQTLVEDLVALSFPRRMPPLELASPVVEVVPEAPARPCAEMPIGAPAPCRPAGPEETPLEPAPVFFKPGEPTSFTEYDGQEHVLALLEDAVRAAVPVPWRGAQALAVEPQLLLGFPGAGKTLLAKILAEELRREARRRGCLEGWFYELFPADIPDVASLDGVMRRAQERPGSVLFIDEIHDFTGPVSRKLYLVLEEGRFMFHASAGPVQLPPLSIVAATTDPGKMHGALKRRFIRHQFKPATPAELRNYVVRRGKGRITPATADLIVNRTHWGGAPWEPLEIYRLAEKAALARGSQQVEVRDVERVIQMQELDDFGLRWMDRAALRALLSRTYTLRSGEVIHAASLADVCSMAQIDPDEFRETVKPRLMSRRLLSQRPGFGQCLTPEALLRYQHLAAS